MTPERWQVVKQIVADAAAIEPEARAAWLRDRCGSDQALREEVESLLAHDSDDLRSPFRGNPFAAVPRDRDPSPSLPLSTVLSGRYELRRRLGVGGMGEVFEAHDRQLDRNVAVKVLPAGLVDSSARRLRFDREIHLMAAMSHPHICAVFDAGLDGPVSFLVMERLEGETLQQRLARGPLGPHEAVACGIQIAEALDYAHRRGLVHRDLKPANVMLTTSGLKVLDFGLAKVVADEVDGAVSDRTGIRKTPDSSLTEEGAILGTLHYMSPEQLEGRAADGRSDIFSLGTVLYEAIAGARAFDGKSHASIVAAILRDDPVPLGAREPLCPPALDHIVNACLAKSPDDRWQNARDVATALRTLGPGVPALSGAGAPRHPGSEDTGRAAASSTHAWDPRRRWLIAAAAVSAVVLAATALMTLRPAAPESDAAFAPRFRFSFQLSGAQQIALDSDQPNFDISNDGETIAWIGTGPPSEQQVFHRSVRDLAIRPVPGTRGVSSIWLQLSPDGRRVMFLRADRLWIAPLDGSSVPQQIFNHRLWSWAWADDGAFVLAEPYRGLLRLSGPGATPETLTQLDSQTTDEVTHQFPHALPGGKGFLFSVGVGDFWSNRVEALSREGTAWRRKVLLKDTYAAKYVAPGHLVFGRGDTIYRTAFDLDTRSITGPETPLVSGVQTDPYGVLTEFAVSRNGTLVYVPD